MKVKQTKQFVLVSVIFVIALIVNINCMVFAASSNPRADLSEYIKEVAEKTSSSSSNPRDPNGSSVNDTETGNVSSLLDEFMQSVADRTQLANGTYPLAGTNNTGSGSGAARNNTSSGTSVGGWSSGSADDGIIDLVSMIATILKWVGILLFVYSLGNIIIQMMKFGKEASPDFISAGIKIVVSIVLMCSNALANLLYNMIT